MRILLVNKYFYRKGGAETYFFALAEGLRALGHEVAFFSMQHPNNESSYWSKYFVSEKDYVGDISAFKKVQEASTLIYSFEARRKFEALLEEFKPDVIHMNNVHRQLTLSILDAPYLKKHHVPVVYTAHDYILVCPAYTMVNGHGEVCDACLDKHFMHAVKNVCVKGSRTKSALATMEAEFLKFHHAYSKIDLIIAPSQFMKSKLDEGGFASKIVAMQNFLTDSQMAMGARVANTHKFEDAQAWGTAVFPVLRSPFQREGHLYLGESVSAGRRALARALARKPVPVLVIMRFCQIHGICTSSVTARNVRRSSG